MASSRVGPMSAPADLTREERDALIKVTLAWIAWKHPNSLPHKLKADRGPGGVLYGYGGYTLPEALENTIHEVDWGRARHRHHRDYQEFVTRTVANWSIGRCEELLAWMRERFYDVKGNKDLELPPDPDLLMLWQARLAVDQRQAADTVARRERAKAEDIAARSRFADQELERQRAEAQAELEADVAALVSLAINENNPLFGSF